MNSHVQKSTNTFQQKSKKKKLNKSIVLAATILSNSIEMKPCQYCEKRGLKCLVSESDSGRCAGCVKAHKSHCEAFLSPQQLLRISRRRDQLDNEVEAVEEEIMNLMAKVTRLRKQRKEWSEKAARAVSRGIDDLEELERIEKAERETAEAVRQAGASMPNLSDSGAQGSSVADWPGFELDPSLLTFLDSGSGGSRQLAPSNLQGSQ